MKVIILGMDNTGKTTLASQLGEYTGYKIMNSLGKDASKEVLEKYMIDNLVSEENCIFERFSFFEEMVYGTILRGKSKFNYNDKVFKVLKDVNPIIIYCRPSIKKIMNFGTREQMNGVIKNSYKLLDEFDSLIRDLKGTFDIYQYNYELDNYKLLWSRIFYD